MRAYNEWDQKFYKGCSSRMNRNRRRKYRRMKVAEKRRYRRILNRDFDRDR